MAGMFKLINPLVYFRLSRDSYSCIISRCGFKQLVYRQFHVPSFFHISQGEFKNFACLSKLKTFRYISLTAKTYKKKKHNMKETHNSETFEDMDDSTVDFDVIKDPEFELLRKDIYSYGSSKVSVAHENVSTYAVSEQTLTVLETGVAVLQPWIKWGPQKKESTTGQLLLDEAVALVNTLPGFKVISKEVVPIRTEDSKYIFGSGALERLVSQVSRLKDVSTVFISVQMMRRIQIRELEKAFGMPVMDRYSVVLGIFHHHARTNEAKLQVALAELPHISKRLSDVQERFLLEERSKKIKVALRKLSLQRKLLRKNRIKSQIPTIAIVGYTNSGKTTLINALTGDSRAEGRDQLFATLDVTAHVGRLPSNVKVLYIDTVGFIQDIPTELVASFKATLEDAVCADMVIHVRDISHPDFISQGITVVETLSSLPLPENTPILTVYNKVDLLANGKPPIATTNNKLQDVVDDRREPRMDDHREPRMYISSVTGEGLDTLLEAAEVKIMDIKGLKKMKFKFETGSDKLSWLRSYVGLTSEEIDQKNPQITYVSAVLSDGEFAAFQRFLKNAS